MEFLFHAFWLFLILAAISPYLRQQTLFSSRGRKLDRFEKKRGTRAVTLIHRQESVSLLGIPIRRYPHIDDSEEVVRAIRGTDQSCPMDVILHMPPGLDLAAEQVADALARHPAKVTVFIPYYAMSAGTLIALAADEIVMDEDAVLGALEPQVGPYPAGSVLTILERKDVKDVDDETLILVDVARRALQQEKQFVRRLLERKGWPADRVEAVTGGLCEGCWTPNCPIPVDEARSLGLTISTNLPPEVHDLMSLYAQPRGGKPSVQYTRIR